jgi:hypothetical protein
MSVNISFHQVKSIKAELVRASDSEHYWFKLIVEHEERKWNNPQNFEVSEFTLFPMSSDDEWNTGSDPKIVEAMRKIEEAISGAFSEPKTEAA